MPARDPHDGDDALARLADALFCSELETGSHATARTIAAEVRAALTRRHTWTGCMRAVADAHVQDQAAAEERLHWARRSIAEALHGDSPAGSSQGSRPAAGSDTPAAGR